MTAADRARNVAEAVKSLKRFETPARSAESRAPNRLPRPVEPARTPKRGAVHSYPGRFAHLNGASLAVARQPATAARPSAAEIAAGWNHAAERIAHPLAIKPAATTAAARSWDAIFAGARP